MLAVTLAVLLDQPILPNQSTALLLDQPTPPNQSMAALLLEEREMKYDGVVL
jgi:hypothetical protein